MPNSKLSDFPILTWTSPALSSWRWHGSLWEWLIRLPPLGFGLLGFLLMILVAGIDAIALYVYCYDFSLVALYLAPVTIVAWGLGLRGGFLAAFLAVATNNTLNGWLLLASTRRFYWMLDSAMDLMAFIGAVWALTQLKKTLQKEWLSSRMDHGVGIGNIRAFWELVTIEFRRLNRKPGPVSIAYIDVDDFKQVNDSLGHSVGDKLLRLIAQTLKGAIRDIDHVARVGGDEFAIMFVGTDSIEIVPAIERLRRDLRTALAAQHFMTTVSIGVVTYNPPPLDINETIAAADKAMYQVKREGKNSVCYVVDPPLRYFADY